MNSSKTNLKLAGFDVQGFSCIYSKASTREGKESVGVGRIIGTAVPRKLPCGRKTGLIVFYKRIVKAPGKYRGVEGLKRLFTPHSMLKSLTDHKVVIPTGNVNATPTIGMCFIVLAYFLHPIVEAAYKRVRAYRAWRAIEKRTSVEVTSYPLVTEMFGRHRKWDAARVVSILLAAFSLASWGLELAMGIGYVNGKEVDLLQRPPPVNRYERSANSVNKSKAWQVTCLFVSVYASH